MDRLAPVQYRLLGYEGVIPGHGGSRLFVMGSFLTVMWSFWPLDNGFDHIYSRKTFSLEENNMVFIQNGTLTGGRKWPSKPGNYPLRPEMANSCPAMTAHMREQSTRLDSHDSTPPSSRKQLLFVSSVFRIPPSGRKRPLIWYYTCA